MTTEVVASWKGKKVIKKEEREVKVEVEESEEEKEEADPGEAVEENPYMAAIKEEERAKKRAEKEKRKQEKLKKLSKQKPKVEVIEVEHFEGALSEDEQ